MAKDLKKPGQDNQKPGNYGEVGPRGGKLVDGRNAKIGAGRRLPPTQKPGNRWVRKDK